ncbi:MAG: VCBS repeat-containing protein [Candidatus Latescibacteria bacterium]|jgi:hypothetical protein|nr:VCBS repeat-containing protein [Candidatus Latescibacterota bacterium]
MSRKQKRILLYSSPIALLIVAAILGTGYLNGIQSDANRLADTGKAAIDMFTAYKTGLEKSDIDGVLSHYSTDYSGENDGRWTERMQSDRDGVRVFEWGTQPSETFVKDDVRVQISGLLARIDTIEYSKFKLDAVEQFLGTDGAIVRSFLWLRGVNSEQEVFESQVLFRMGLQRTGDTWKISSQELIYGKTVTGDRTGFVDITEEAGVDFATQHNPDWFTPEWEPKMFGIIKYGSAGVAAADYDNDGWYDLFFGDGKEPKLFRNDGDGTFTDVTEKVGLPTEMHGINVSIFVDFDNDGDKDLFLGCGTDNNRLYQNDGDGTFTDVTEGSGIGGILVTVAAAGDYDNDGLTDLYLGRYLDPRINLPTTLFFTRNSEGNSLLRNDGGLRFTDVTETAGVRDGGLTLGVAWGDYDSDGFQDLYVSNDFGRNAMYHNEGDGTFTDVSTATGTHDFGFGMSATFGDIDNDGDLDIYVSNVHSSQRWYGQAATLYQYLVNSIEQGTILEDLDVYREIVALVGADWNSYGDRMVKGNSLMINDGKGNFTDVAEETHTNPYGWYWGSTMFDYDNDGKKDIFAANGWVSATTYNDL